MLDVARAAGVSKNTVSLALRNSPQIPESTRKRIMRLAEKLGYAKNPTVSHLMAQLRSGSSTGHKATLALINGNDDPNAFTTHPTIPNYVEGCQRRAALSGYTLDKFWLHDPSLDGEKLNKILHARNIRGAVIIGLMNTNRLPERFAPMFEQHPCVVTGVRTRDPVLSFACTDHHMLTLRAVEQALRMGYQRPALVLDGVIDHLVEGRFTSGVMIAQQELPPARRLKPFYQVTEARQHPELFQRWYEKEKPDVILTLYHVVKQWVQDMGLKVPDDVALIQLEWRQDHASWAGMNQHNDVVGEAAIEMLISMIHSNQVGVPEFPQATLVGSTWVSGDTIRDLNPA